MRQSANFYFENAIKSRPLVAFKILTEDLHPVFEVAHLWKLHNFNRTRLLEDQHGQSSDKRRESPARNDLGLLTFNNLLGRA